MNQQATKIIFGAIVVVVALVAGYTLFSTKPARAEDGKAEMYQQLNEWRKEIVKLRYTDYCASVVPPPAGLVAVIQKGVEAKHPAAIEGLKWLEQVMEKYAEKGCGDL